MNDFDKMEKLGELIRNYRPRTKITKCWHPNKSECKGTIKHAHALQENRIIKKIAVKGMVQTLEGRSNIFFQDAKIKGKGQATTFWGFCDYHDSVVFNEIENKDYCCSNVQNFLFAYRTFIWHRHKKIESITSETHFILSALESGFPLTNDFIDIIKGFEQNQQDGEFYQRIFDEMLISKNYDRLRSKIWELDFEVSFAISAILEPEFDLLGKKIYDENIERLPGTFLNIFPANNKSYCIWSWLDCDDNYYKDYVEQFFALSERNKKNYFNNYLTAHTDALLISPELWDSFGKEIQNSIITHANASELYLCLARESNGKKFRKFSYSQTPWNLFSDLTRCSF